MRIKLHFFALSREITGERIKDLEVDKGTNLQVLKGIVENQFPKLRDLPLIIAVNGQNKELSYLLQEGDEVSFLPPFSGGEFIELTPNPISPEEVINKVRKETFGAIVSFVGTVRGISEGKRVQYLEFEAHPQMAEEKLRGIVKEIEEHWGIKEVAISHRIGKVKTGEVIIVIAIGAPHRKEAFEACQFAIDRLKETVPIWKKEVFEEGERWVI